MTKVKAQLSVFFEEPFWIGIYERMEANKIEVCKITFGPEPKDYEVYSFLVENWKDFKFSPPVPGTALEERRINPKRMQREIAHQLQNPRIGTKAQQALKALQEENKAERKSQSRLKNEAEKDRQYEIRQQKKKEKHKGR
ncbi:MAG TPA: YjdF family protein [Anaerovoracaceae bacterium]|nr:YjdF family protein [Anaerovoracaceae bacterium]